MNMISSFSGRYAFLSNFHYSPITIQGLEFATVEHAFQAYKMINLENAMKVRNCRSPGRAKQVARELPKRDNWEDIKRAVMYECCKAKFQDPDLRWALANTGNASLVEGNTWGDTYWGVCGSTGQNWLGKILVVVRRENADEDRGVKFYG